MPQKCQKKWSAKTNLSLVHGSAEDLPFADNSFDIVFHSGGINFFSDKAKAISEMIRIAKPGTKILIANETADYIDSQYKKAHFLKNILTTQLLIYEKLKTQFLILFTKKIWNLFGTKNFTQLHFENNFKRPFSGLLF